MTRALRRPNPAARARRGDLREPCPGKVQRKPDDKRRYPGSVAVVAEARRFTGPLAVSSQRGSGAMSTVDTA
ncbi:hypothetical protein GCM10017567_04470 [Amycolatopsis bullii]|uniref:Uncharacterized protein n=1 Tax=Amycolatopsis bullii TaxID=941987 RepID=A0ABQ3JWG8_9PSEU|nr:hypothetical protein GCM10017567_04470 [Amycolatopsis bullii]